MFVSGIVRLEHRSPSTTLYNMSTNASATSSRASTPDPFWDVTTRFLYEENARFAENLPAGGDWRFGIHAPFNPTTYAHERDSWTVPEITWPGPPSPGLQHTPFDNVLMFGWGAPEGDDLDDG